MASIDWSDEENDLIVADYFDMLRLELAGASFNKAERNRMLQSRLVTRSRGSIEFKHQNVTAAMIGLNQPWIEGYKPKSNFQFTLVDAVVRQLNTVQFWSVNEIIEKNLNEVPNIGVSGVQEDTPLWIGPPPTVSNAPPPIEPTLIERILRKYDVAERDASNRALGKAGEERVLRHEVQSLTSAGRIDLAKKVQWTSEVDGDGAGYDIASFELDGSPRLIEVKTTNGWERSPFHISRNELAVAEERRDCWCLLRLWNFAREPKAFEIRPPLDAHVSLMATSYMASFASEYRPSKTPILT